MACTDSGEPLHDDLLVSTALRAVLDGETEAWAPVQSFTPAIHFSEDALKREQETGKCVSGRVKLGRYRVPASWSAGGSGRYLRARAGRAKAGRRW
jgi:hypothetical protein